MIGKFLILFTSLKRYAREIFRSLEHHRKYCQLCSSIQLEYTERFILQDNDNYQNREQYKTSPLVKINLRTQLIGLSISITVLM